MVAIFVVLTVLICVSIDALIEKRRLWSAPAGRPETRRVRPFGERLSLPPGLFIHPGHSWVDIQLSGVVRIGIDDFVGQVLGRPDRVSLLPSGKCVAQGEPIITLERDGHQIALPAPLSGVIQTSNNTLVTQPGSVVEAPFERGWIYTLQPSRLEAEIGLLSIAATAAAWLIDEVERFVDWVADVRTRHPIDALADGGMPTVGVLAHLSDADWEDFQENFLTSLDPRSASNSPKKDLKP